MLITAMRRRPAPRAVISFDATMVAPARKQAAGMLFVAPDGDVLLLRRSLIETNFAGHWALPGGGVEDGETPELGAERECREEIGECPRGARQKIDQRNTPNGWIFHTFAQRVADKFTPKLNDEHTGYVWASLSDLPQPVHPAVQATLDARMCAACGGNGQLAGPGISCGECNGFGFKAIEVPSVTAQDAKLAMDRAVMAGMPKREKLAFDYAGTVRSIDKDGRMKVAITNISKAVINPYRGEEIPGGDELGLDPAKIYYLLRDPEELKKAAHTFNGIPLLDCHVVVTADDHRKERTIGATGTDAEYDHPYLKNSLSVWTQGGIDLIESESKKELSSAYHYRADMTPGEYEGKKYDGVMRDIVGNHVALVEEGRAGSDVVVGDSAIPKTNGEITMSKAKALSLKAHVAHGALLSYLAPKLAKDSKIDLGPALKGITHKNFGTKKAALKKAVAVAMDGKLAEDMSLEGLDELLNMVEKTPVAGEDEATMDPKDGKNKEPVAGDEDDDTDDKDSEGAAGMDESDEDDDMAGDEDMTAEEKAAAEKKKAKDKKAKDKAAKDKAAKDAECTAAEKAAAKDKKAMDAQIKLAADEAVKTERKNQQAIAEAREAVRPHVAISATMAFDSAGAVYRHALETLDIDVSKVTDDAALPIILGNLPKHGSQSDASNTTIAMDEAGTADFTKRFPNVQRIGHA